MLDAEMIKETRDYYINKRDSQGENNNDILSISEKIELCELALDGIKWREQNHDPSGIGEYYGAVNRRYEK
jgi:hypothetical protein